MIDGRGGEDGEPDRLKARRFLQAEARERAIELDGLQEGEPMGGERGQAFETIGRLGSSQRCAQIRRGNRAAIGSQFIIGLRGERGLHGRDPGSVERGIRSRRRLLRARRALFLETGANFRPAAVEKSPRPTLGAHLGRGGGRPSSAALRGFPASPAACPSAAAIASASPTFVSDLRNQGQDNTFPLSKLFQKIDRAQPSSRSAASTANVVIDRFRGECLVGAPSM